MGLIYKLTSPSGKSYIGQTTRSFERRLQEHCQDNGCKILHAAINKYGIEEFLKEILVECDDSELDIYECQYIKELNTLEPNGYNIRSGGSNGKHSELSKERMRQKKLGANNHNYGKPRSDQFKAILSEKKSGPNHHFYGKSFTEEHKLNLSKSHKKDNLPMYLVSIKARPETNQSGGYAVCNHPNLKNKWFTSGKYTDAEKLKFAMGYLNSSNGEGSTTK